LWACARDAASSESWRAGASGPKASSSLSGMSRRERRRFATSAFSSRPVKRVFLALHYDRIGLRRPGPPSSPSPTRLWDPNSRCEPPSAGITAKRTHIINGVAAGTSSVFVEPNWLGPEEHHKHPRPRYIGQGPLFNATSSRLSVLTCFQGTKTLDERIPEAGEPSSAVLFYQFDPADRLCVLPA
jgi:hypothetical protein